MNRLTQTLCLVCLWALMPTVAFAQDFTAEPKSSSKKAQKVLIALHAVGMTDPKVAEFVHAADARIDDGRLRLAEGKLNGGKLTLGYELDGIGVDRLQLNYQPEDARLNYTATPESVAVRYQLKF